MYSKYPPSEHTHWLCRARHWWMDGSVTRYSVLLLWPPALSDNFLCQICCTVAPVVLWLTIPCIRAFTCSSRGVQRWTVHFGISDVFQRFLGHLEPLNQNPSDATLAPLSILQNSRWRPRWPPSEWKLLKWPYFLLLGCKMLIAPKRLKLRTSNLTCTFPGTVRTWPLKIFRKGGVARVTWPPKFLGVKC